MKHFAGKMARTFLLSAVAAVLLAGFAVAAEAEQAVAVGATTGSDLRMRSEASTSSSIVTMLDKGVAVAILDDTLDGWYKVAYNGSIGYVSADFLVVDQDNVFETYGRVNATDVNIRADATTESDVVTVARKGAAVTVSSFENGWYDITFADGTEGYIRSDFLNLTSNAPAAHGSGNSSIADTAMQYLGVRYAWGGSSPSGFDCSGFTMYVYGQHGYSLPHSATSQWQSGLGSKIYSIYDLQPGDLVFFNDPARNAGKACSHAGIYVGNGQHVHASSAKSGVVVSDLTSGYYNRYFIGGIRA